MPDHDGFFARVSKNIAPGGVIVGSVPNVRFYTNIFQVLLEKDWHYTQDGILDERICASSRKKSEQMPTQKWFHYE